MEPIVFRAVRDIPTLGVVTGDDVVFNPRAPRQFTLCKTVDPAGTLLSFEQGALIALGCTPRLADLWGLVTPGSAKGRLHLVRG